MLQIKPKPISTPKASQITGPIELIPDPKDPTDPKPTRYIQKPKKKIVLTGKILSPNKIKTIYPINSLSNLRTSNINTLKSLKKTKPSDISPTVLNSDSNLMKKSNLNISTSPSSFQKNSVKHDSYIIDKKSPKASNLKNKPKIQLKQLKLIKDLEKNQKLMNGEIKYKCKSCLENIIELEDLWINEKCKGIEENFRKCNLIVRDFIVRMQEIGKNNEGVLLDKLWKHIVLSVDEYIDQFFRTSSLNDLSDSDMTIKKISILEDIDSFDLNESMNDKIEDVGVKEKIRQLETKFDALNKIVTNEWKQVNRRYLDCIVFRNGEALMQSSVKVKS